MFNEISIQTLLEQPVVKWSQRYIRWIAGALIGYLVLREPIRILRDKYFAYVYSGTLLKALDHAMKEFRIEMADDIRKFQADNPGTAVRILEIGMGPGTSIEFYPKDVAVLTCEPNEYFYEKLLELQKTHLNLCKVFKCSLEDLDQISEESVDFVVSTLVLCSVRSQEQSLDKIKTFLKKGGRFYFFEHEAAQNNLRQYICQTLVDPFWSLLYNGCHLTRDTTRAIERKGLRMSKVEHKLGLLNMYLTPYAKGYATNV